MYIYIYAWRFILINILVSQLDNLKLKFIVLPWAWRDFNSPNSTMVGAILLSLMFIVTSFLYHALIIKNPKILHFYSNLIYFGSRFVEIFFFFFFIWLRYLFVSTHEKINKQWMSNCHARRWRLPLVLYILAKLDCRKSLQRLKMFFQVGCWNSYLQNHGLSFIEFEDLVDFLNLTYGAVAGQCCTECTTASP